LFIASKEEMMKNASLVNTCMMDNSMMTVVGVVVGTAVSLRTKQWRPFAIGVTFGTLGDMVYGYSTSCRQHIVDYNKAKEKYEVAKLDIEKNSE
jgi:hypothetical protein